jgi:hypothetical protein
VSDGRDPFAFGPPQGGDPWGPPPGHATQPAPPPNGPGHGFQPGFPPGAGHQPATSAWPPAGGDFPFAPSPGLDGVLTAGRPPTGWLAGALAAAVAGVVAVSVAVLLRISPWPAFAAWALAGPIAIGMLAAFSRSDIRQRARPIYSARSSASVLYWSAVAVAAIGIGLSAWQIADWAGRL